MSATDTSAMDAPPRLPRRSGLDGPRDGGLAERLGELVTRRATGALHGAAGTVYIAEGALADARSALAVDAEELGPYAPAPAQLLCRLTTVLDAAFFVLSSEEEPLRFQEHVRSPSPRPVHCTVRALHRSVLRRRALLERVWPWPAVDTAAVRPLPAAAADGLGQCPSSWRGVLGAADGARTPPQIARVLGRSSFSTLLEVRRMASAGLVETPGLLDRADPAPLSRQPAAPVPPPARAAPDAQAALLLRLRTALEARL